MDFKDIIKTRRSELGLTLDDVARYVGVSGATVSRWESGDIENMRRDKIAKLAEILRVTPSYLMGWENDSSEQDLGLTALDVAKWLEVMCMTIGQRIKEARKNAGLTQRELAEKSGTATGTIQQYELGERQPRLEQLQAFAAVLGIQVVDLLGPYDGPPLPGLADGDKLDEMEPFNYSPSMKRVNAAMNKLNSDGQQKAAERVEELTEIPRYRAETTPQSTPAPQEGKDTTPAPDAPETPSEGE